MLLFKSKKKKRERLKRTLPSPIKNQDKLPRIKFPFDSDLERIEGELKLPNSKGIDPPIPWPR